MEDEVHVCAERRRLGLPNDAVQSNMACDLPSSALGVQLLVQYLRDRSEVASTNVYSNYYGAPFSAMLGVNYKY